MKTRHFLLWDQSQISVSLHSRGLCRYYSEKVYEGGKTLLVETFDSGLIVQGFPLQSGLRWQLLLYCCVLHLSFAV